MDFDTTHDFIFVNDRNIRSCEKLMHDLLLNHVIETYKQKRFTQGIEACKKLLALDEKNALAWHNLGLGLAYTRCYQESIKSYQKSIDLNPPFLFDSILNQSYPLLITGNFRRGLKSYEYRINKFQTKPLLKNIKQSRLWNGESIAGKTLLVHQDGGFGDTIQFIRFLPYLKGLGCKILLFLQPELNCLFEHLDIPLITDSTIIYDYDLHVFMASLPYCLNADFSTIPAPIRLPSKPRPIKKRIGIVWKGGRKNEDSRAIKLQELEPIIRIPGFEFVCVQKEVNSEEKELLKTYNIAQPLIESFIDTVKVLEECEQVITIDSSVAHLSSSIGIPTCILLDYNACWRWLIDRSDSPWYPKATLFRQSQMDIWDHPVQHLARHLEQTQ